LGNSFHLSDLISPGLDGIVHAISDRPGLSEARRRDRANETLTLILSFLPRDVVEMTLSGHTVLFNELIADSARDVLRGMTDEMKLKSLSGLVNMARVVQGSVDRLEKRGNAPARTEIEASDEEQPEDAVVETRTEVAVDIAPSPEPGTEEIAAWRAAAGLLSTGPDARVDRAPGGMPSGAHDGSDGTHGFIFGDMPGSGDGSETIFDVAIGDRPVGVEDGLPGGMRGGQPDDASREPGELRNHSAHDVTFMPPDETSGAIRAEMARFVDASAEPVEESSWLDEPFVQWVIETPADLTARAAAKARDEGHADGVARPRAGRTLADAALPRQPEGYAPAGVLATAGD
jgi:hypothetical protein